MLFERQPLPWRRPYRASVPAEENMSNPRPRDTPEEKAELEEDRALAQLAESREQTFNLSRAETYSQT